MTQPPSVFSSLLYHVSRGTRLVVVHPRPLLKKKALANNFSFFLIPREDLVRHDFCVLVQGSILQGLRSWLQQGAAAQGVVKKEKHERPYNNLVAALIVVGKTPPL